MTKKFWILESNLAHKPFYAKSPNDSTFDVQEALKFRDFNEAFVYRQKHETLRFYNLKEHEFEFGFGEEDAWVRDERQLNFEMGEESEHKRNDSAKI